MNIHWCHDRGNMSGLVFSDRVGALGKVSLLYQSLLYLHQVEWYVWYKRIKLSVLPYVIYYLTEWSLLSWLNLYWLLSLHLIGISRPFYNSELIKHHFSYSGSFHVWLGSWGEVYRLSLISVVQSQSVYYCWLGLNLKNIEILFGLLDTLESIF